MNAPPFPTNPAPGDVYCGWTWNGTQWICTQGQQIVVQTFTANGTYLPSPGLLSLVVECVGGGGDGGAVSGVVSTVAGGGGGGSGGYSRKALSAALVRGGIIVTIGPGGAVAQPPNPNDYALYGGATSFGALCVAEGGGGGGGNASALDLWGWPGLGAAAGVGDVALPGNPGQIGTTANAPAGSYINVIGGGGGAIWGGGSTPTLMGVGEYAPGAGGMGPGAGGAGAGQNEVAGGAPGGKGANGICVVTEYCFADMGWSGGGGCCPPTGVGQARVAIPAGPQGRGGWGYEDGDD